MKKTTEEELNMWRYGYPSTAVSWNLNGDVTSCQAYVGEAANLLYGLKNRMKLGGLKSLQTYRNYPDGTTIIARSVFGMDYIEIISGKAIAPSCKIRLYDDNYMLLHLGAPRVVPPMKWYELDVGQEEHHKELRVYDKTSKTLSIKNPEGEEEVEGYDYIKTYYSWTTIDCAACSPLTLTVAQGDDSWVLTGSSPNRPFWYKSENDNGTLIYNYNGIMVPHHMGYDWTDPVVPPNPLNHTIYSFSGCQAEILEISVYKDGVDSGKTTFFMSDERGSYFVWKAYTEWTNNGPRGMFGIPIVFSRTGLGYMLMKGFITNQGIVLCESDPTIIKVDCCEKTADERAVIMYWESLGGHEVTGPTCVDQPFMFMGNMKVCEVPPEVAGWYARFCVGFAGKRGNNMYYYMFPETKGSCLPLTWTWDNPFFEVLPAIPNGETAAIHLAEGCVDPETAPKTMGGCETNVIVTVKDRCRVERDLAGLPGTDETEGMDQTKFLSCCEIVELNPFSIGYTTLSPGLSVEQMLNTNNGCVPVTWSFTGNGSLKQGAELPYVPTRTDVAYYTSPDSNPGCENVDTVTATDCCGRSATIEFTVTANTAGSICLSTLSVFPGACAPYWGTYMCYTSWSATETVWDCAGNETHSHSDSGAGYGAYCYEGAGTDPRNYLCEGCGSCVVTMMEMFWNQGTVYRCWAKGQPVPWNVVGDQRSAAQIAAGCCPINPLTGLPF